MPSHQSGQLTSHHPPQRVGGTPGHLFVLNGRLEALGADAVVISTDSRFSIGDHWRPAAGLGAREDWAGLRPQGWQRGSALPASRQPRPDRQVWFLDAIGATPDEVGRAAARAIERIAWAGTERLHATAHAAGRDLPLVAIPVLGTAGGGHDLERGLVIDSLLAHLTAAAGEHGVDVALVASSRSDYSALQHRRRAAGRRALPTKELDDQARDLGDRAARGDLALFFGAGVSIAAGLPSWGALLEKLVEAMGLDITPEDLKGLGSLEQAELLQVTLAKRSGRHDEAARRDSQEQLGRQVASILARDDLRPSLAHCLLAGMRVPEAVTTNYDHLYEEAVAASSGLPADQHDRAISTLPWDPTDAARPWVLKMHGDVDRPATIVLSRSSFVRYDTRWKPVGSLVQSLMMTKHLLVVGASMTDDNLLRFAYEVAGLREELVAAGAPGGPGSEIGTVVHLADDVAFSRLWAGRFDVVVASPPLPDDGAPAHATTSRGEKEAEAARRRRAARGLTVFLDTVAMHAERDAPHLLDDRYLPASPDEAALVRRLREDAHAVRQRADVGGDRSAGWRELAEALERFGTDR
ncbi:SIR2 family protein [Oerskovia sp. NPDC060287]|uniref:SIR2 family protein n=1 Tax=Oerskovia sp. NPDC060287 TaxID=3347095 RepID=UPI003648D70E